jgi:hypothetical protein
MFLFLFSLVMAQQEKCFLLEGSAECPGLEQFAILESDLFKTPAELDTYLIANSYNSPKIIDTFKQQLRCNAFDGSNVRFTDSTLCAFFVTLSAEKCRASYKDPAARFSFCSATCDAHINSLTSVLGNTTICEATTDPQVLETRRLLTQVTQGPTNVNNLCAALKNDPAASAPTCFKGLKDDFAQCGFLTAGETTAFCAANPTEACCVEFAAKPATTGTEVLNPANNAFVIAGIVAGVLAFLGIAFLIFQRISKSNQRPTTVYRQSKFQSKTQSKMFSLFKENEQQPPLPQFDPPKARSSLFTTIRASQILNPSAAPALPKPFQNNSRPFTELEDDEYKVQVFEDYDAGMDDEISCSIGDIILVKEEYDDGILY